MTRLLTVGGQILRVLFMAHNTVRGDPPIAALHIFHGDLNARNVLVVPAPDGRPTGDEAMVIDWGGYSTNKALLETAAMRRADEA